MWIFANYWFLQEINRAQMDLDYTKYTKESLEFIYSEGQKHFDEITKSFREVNSKSYIIIGILFSLLGVLLSEIITMQQYFNLHGLLFFFLVFPTVLILQNLLPVDFIITGAKPSLMQHQYFEESTELQYEKYLAQRIEDCDHAILHNGKILTKRARRFKSAVILILASLIVSFIFWLCFIT